MLKKLTAALIIAAIPALALAEGPAAVKMKGSDFKNFNAYEVDGTFYTAPLVLTKGGKWKLSWEKDRLYVYTTPPAMKKEEKVEIPYREIEGNKYVDFSFFSGQAGLEYTYKPKKKELTVKKKKEKKEGKEKALPAERPLVLWDINYSFRNENSDFAALSGTHILSPTMGSYEDIEKGSYSWNFDYLKRARENSMEVMPLIHNDFEVKKTSLFMHDAKRQEAFISQITALSEVYGLYGYNMDFENMDPKDKDLFTDFMKNLSVPLHEGKKKLTADITVYNAGSPTWSLCYDRTKLADFCDYEIIMGYDETPRTSPYAGSVSSYGWLDKNIQKLITMVPPEKLILGLPFYTRIYEGNPGYMKSKVLAMKDQEALINRHGLKPVWQPDARQYTLTWRQGGILHRTYLEEEHSLRAKAALEKEYYLAGLAFWRYGFEKKGIFEELEGKGDGKQAGYPLAADRLGGRPPKNNEGCQYK